VPGSKTKEWEVGDYVKLKTLYPGHNGKRGRLTRVGEYDVDVRVGNFILFMHKDQLEEDSARA
jgi:hypothetical protein